MSESVPLPPRLNRLAQVSLAFTPSAPVDDVRLFAERPDQIFSCIDAFFQKGTHIALFGERGVGKTSLANIMPQIIQRSNLSTLAAIRVDCNTNDDFNKIWRKIFRELGRTLPVLDDDGANYGPVDAEEIRFGLQDLERRTLIVIDEFDRVEHDESLSLLADTVKTLSDHAVDATLMFVGVASSVEALLGEHESIVRNVKQIPMPRMSYDELENLLDRGFAAIDSLSISEDAKARIVAASEGLPHFAHLLGLHSAQTAVQNDRHEVIVADVEKAEDVAMRTHSMVSEYRRATHSPQPDHLFEQVLLACAYTPRDELGFFRAGDVRAPLSVIVGREMGHSGFSRHLRELSGPRLTLQKDGEPRHYVYRFRNPLFQPFVKMVGRAKGLVRDEIGRQLQEAQVASTAPSIYGVSSMKFD